MQSENLIKDIPLKETHIKLGAKMVPFAGYNMPVTYSGLKLEHAAVRNGVGMFDVSHMGEFVVEGPQALDLLQWVTSNDVSKLDKGDIQYSCFPNKDGGIVDDLLVYCESKEKYYLVVNASNIDKDFAWINKNNTFDAEVINMSDSWSLLAVQGPKAIDTLQKLTSINLSEIKYYNYAMGDFCGIDNVVLSNTGYTGSGGFEIYIDNKYAVKIWEAIMEAGAEFGILPCGLGARDTLRLEKGFCLYGNDINDTTSPIEAGLGWITKFSKDFINKAHHLNLKENGVSKKLVGFELLERGIPRQHYNILDADGNTIGEVTSGTQSPTLNKPIGMGYVTKAFAKRETEIFVVIRNKPVKAKVVKIPFLA